MTKLGILVMVLVCIGFSPVSLGQGGENPDPAVLAFKNRCDKNPAHTSDDGRRICTCLAMRTKNNSILRDELVQKLIDPKKTLGQSARLEMSYCSNWQNYRSYTIKI